MATAALLASLIMSTVSGEMKCKLRYDERVYMNWYDFGSNFVYGMYD